MWKSDPPVLTNRSRDAFITALTEWIQHDPFRPAYRKKLFEAEVCGWDARLTAYFWPKPTIGYAETIRRLDPLAKTAERLAEPIHCGREWTKPEESDAVRLALDLFKWGGTPQPTPLPTTVHSVFKTALDREDKWSAPLNSGWTKIAAFATAHLDGGVGHPQAIWDSRVATSITSRLDELIFRSGMKNPERLFSGVGTVAGRGGSRPRQLHFHWPIAYGRWQSQFQGSLVVERIRDVLNSGSFPAMPRPRESGGSWTARGVEMVLFGDGY